MKNLRIIVFAFCSASLSLSAAQESPIAAAPAATAAANPLVWDSMEKTYEAMAHEPAAKFTFWVTNTSSAEITIQQVHTSCGCTTPQLPPMPWKLAPGTNGSISASVDIKGKSGTLVKHLTVNSTAGQQLLAMKMIIAKDPIETMGERERNMQIAKADRQAVFKDDCAKCHFTPALTKKDPEEIYLAACAICHEPEAWAKAAGRAPEAHHRNEIVPDLAKLKTPLTRQAWKIIAANGGKPGTLMPAFSKRSGGPLTDEQLDLLVGYLQKRFPFDPANVLKDQKAELHPAAK